MPIYEPLTDVIPTPANGVVVPSAWGDQTRDDLVASYQGWWFRALGGATSLTNGAYTVVPMTSIVQSTTATDEAAISIVSGAVTVRRPGLWFVCACVAFNSSSLTGIAIGATDATSTFATEALIDSTGVHAARSTSGIVNVTSTTATFTLNVYQSTGAALPVTVNNYSPRLMGLWLCEHP